MRDSAECGRRAASATAAGAALIAAVGLTWLAAPPARAHGGAADGFVEGLADSFAKFGADWLHVFVVLATLAVLGGVLAWASPSPRREAGPVTPVLWLADGAGRVTGLPAWGAGALALLLAGLVVLVLGFFWDVAWHIAIGRDEFLFSPPHVMLLTGILLVGVGTAVGVWLATRDGAPAAWRLRSVRVPAGAAPLAAATAIAVVGFSIDELWHWAYGIDVTMWSPPHLLMIVPMSLSPLGAWLLLAEACRHAATPPVGAPGAPPATADPARSGLLGWRPLAVVLAGAALVGLSAYQLEFDLAVPQWPQGYHPILLALAAGLGLTAARAALGRGGALAALAAFWALRGLLFGATAALWDLGEPRIPLYLAAAVGVELVWWAAQRRGWPPAAAALGSGAAVGTLGLAGEAAWSHVWAWHPWQSAILPWLPVAAAAALGAAWLGAALGRVLGDQPPQASWRSAALALAVVVAALAAPLPRGVPDAEVVVRTREAAPGWVDVTVDVTPADLPAGADRFEVLSWQGGDSQITPLEPAGGGGGTFATPEAVPAHGEWKSIVRLGRGRDLGGMPIYIPADSFIDAAEVPVVERREGSLLPDQHLLLREAHAGPAWPGAIGYTALLVGTAVVLALYAASTARLRPDRPGQPAPAGWAGHDGDGSGPEAPAWTPPWQDGQAYTERPPSGHATTSSPQRRHGSPARR